MGFAWVFDELLGRQLRRKPAALLIGDVSGDGKPDLVRGREQ